MIDLKTVIPQEKVTAFCERHQIRKLALFGSVLRDDFGSNSDIDVLVEFEPEAAIGLEFVTMQDELSEILGRQVDLLTPGFLSRHFRSKVVDTAQVIYERAG
jgi:uncharacterized protein